ncbi:MAG TPA: hypothetical protein VIK14_16710 [Ignavibacteria bacterium]
METKVLLTTNRDQLAEFERSLNNVIQRSNELIDTWRNFQDFHQVTTLDDFLALVSDPVATLDKFLIASVDIKIVGSKTKLNPEIIASMLNIDRESWINLVEGKQPKLDCIPCRSIKVRKGTPMISLGEFQQYEKYLTWQNNKFSVAEQSVIEKQESAKVYITDPAQTELYNYFHDACNTLNSLFDKAYIGTDTLISFSKQIQSRLTYSYGDNRLHVNEPLLMAEVLKLGSGMNNY